MRQIPESEWPYHPKGLKEVWRNGVFLVQVYDDRGRERISVNRIKRKGARWEDGIDWDELQKIKRQIGRGDRWAVECYPPDAEVVNDANMRHLWMLKELPTFGWWREFE